MPVSGIDVVVPDGVRWDSQLELDENASLEVVLKIQETCNLNCS